MVGIAFFGLLKLAKQQVIASDEYSKETTRYDREKRLIDLINK